MVASDTTDWNNVRKDFKWLCAFVYMSLMHYILTEWKQKQYDSKNQSSHLGKYVLFQENILNNY